MIDQRKKAKLIAALKAGRSVTAAADEAGFTRSAVYKLEERDADVRDALELARRRGGRGRRREVPQVSPPGDSGAEAGPAPVELRTEALATLRAIHLDAKASARDRVAAARGVLSALPIGGAPPIVSPGPGGADVHAEVDASERVRVLEGARALVDRVKRERQA